MATVNIQNNPLIVHVGTKHAEATLVTSQISAGTTLVQYQIEKISSGEVLNFDSRTDASCCKGTVVAARKDALGVILESRTKYRARARAQFGAYSAWVNFTTRDKRYSTPHAITQLTDDADASAQTQGIKIVGNARIAQGGRRTIVVTNNASATETDNGRASYNAPRKWGPTTVVNLDKVHNDVTLQSRGKQNDSEGTSSFLGTAQVPVRFTNAGATIVVDNTIKYTNRGATINVNTL